MLNLQIPVDGSSVAVSDFGAAAKAALESIPEGASDAEKAQAKDAIAAAASLIKAGHVGSGNVFVTIGGIGASEQLAPGVGAAIVSITVNQRPAPPKAAAAPALPALAAQPPVSPYDTGAKPDEIAREAANRGALGLEGASLEAVAADFGAPVPATAGAGGEAAATQSGKTSNRPLKGKALAAATAKGKADAKPAVKSGPTSKAAAKPAGAAPGSKAATTAAADPYAGGSQPAGSAGLDASTHVAGPSAPKATQGAGPLGEDKAPQSNPKTAAPKAGAVEKQVAKDRSGK